MKAPVKTPAVKRMSAKAKRERIAWLDAQIEKARGSPGFEYVRAAAEAAKLGPVRVRRLFNVKTPL